MGIPSIRYSRDDKSYVQRQLVKNRGPGAAPRGGSPQSVRCCQREEHTVAFLFLPLLFGHLLVVTDRDKMQTGRKVWNYGQNSSSSE